jgi:quercetin dioxygenase-like cupin family protein
MSEAIGNQHALRPAPGGMLTLDLSDEIRRLRAGPEWASSDRHSASLVKDEALNIMLMVLKKGARLGQHHTKGPIAIQVVEGSVSVDRGAAPQVVRGGMMLALARDVPHGVSALEDSAVLLITSIA